MIVSIMGLRFMLNDDIWMCYVLWLLKTIEKYNGKNRC